MLNFLIDLVPYRYVLSLTYIDDNVFQIWTREYLLMNPSYSGVIVVISKDGKNIWGWGVITKSVFICFFVITIMCSFYVDGNNFTVIY